MSIDRSRLKRAAIAEVILLAASTVGWLFLGGDATPLLAGITAALLMSGILFGSVATRIRGRSDATLKLERLITRLAAAGGLVFVALLIFTVETIADNVFDMAAVWFSRVLFVRTHVDRRNISPDLLIVSDASRYGGVEEGMLSGGKPLPQLLRSNQVQFDELHRRVYKDVTGIDDVSSEVGDSPMVFTADYPSFLLAKDSPKPGELYPPKPAPGERQRVVIPSRLRTIVVPATREATDAVLMNHTTCAGPAGGSPATTRARVSGFSTLRELTPLEVREAFWLGYTLGDAYRVAMECARSQITGEVCAASPKSSLVDCASDPAILQP